MFKNTLPLIGLLLFCLNIHAQTKHFKTQLDSIQTLRNLSKNSEFDIETRIAYAKRASELSYITEVDSTIYLSDINQIDFFLSAEDFDALKKLFIGDLNLPEKPKTRLR